MLSIYEARDPVDWSSVAFTRSDLAEMHRVLGHFDTAESLMVSIVAMEADRLPRDGFYATYLNNLGVHLWNQGRFAEAERLYREALTLSVGDSLATCIRVANAYLNLGVILRDQNRPREAEPLFLEALDQAMACDQDGIVPTRLYAHNELAVLYARTGRNREAIPLWTRALELLDAEDGAFAEYRGQILHDLGEAKLGTGDAPGARETLLDALIIRETALGLDHPEVGVTLTALAGPDGPEPREPPSPVSPWIGR